MNLHVNRSDPEGGGVAIALHSNINCTLLPIFQLQVIEPVGVMVETSIGPIKIIAAYCPKQATINDGTSAALKQDLTKLTRRQGQFILAGGLNARHETWGNTRRNRNSLILQQDLEEGHSDQMSYTLSIDRVTKDLIRLRNTKRRQYQRTGLPTLKAKLNACPK